MALRFLSKRENIPLISAAALILTGILAWLAPEEVTLGRAVKLVYVHAAMMWVGFGMLTIGGLTGLIFLLRREPALINWSYGCTSVGVGLFIGTGILGAITAKITWGGIFWNEPRLIMLGQILLAALAGALVIWLVGSNAVGGAVNFFLASITWILVFRTEIVIHPRSPIFGSDSLMIKVFPLLITATIAVAGLQIVRYWTSSE